MDLKEKIYSLELPVNIKDELFSELSKLDLPDEQVAEICKRQLTFISEQRLNLVKLSEPSLRNRLANQEPR